MKKKLIEVALPLEAINMASAREKSIRTATLHVAPVVGAATVCGGAGGDFCADGGRPLGASGSSSRPRRSRRRSASGCSASSKNWCCGRTPPTRRCCSRRGMKSGRAGAMPARRTPTIRGRRNCSTGTSCPPSTTPSPAAGRCRWKRSGWGWRATPAT